MRESFFLIQLIDKHKNNTIQRLRKIESNIFSTGQSVLKSDKVYIQGIEPTPSFKRDNEFNAPIGRTSSDTSSIWLGTAFKLQDTFEENLEFYVYIHRWLSDSLYMLRFLININLKAILFFYCSAASSPPNPFEITIVDKIDTFCDGPSSYHKSYNNYDKVFPLLEKLMQFHPSNKMKALMYNYSQAAKGDSVVSSYFFHFATLEGIIHNWCEENGYSELWGGAIANKDEQKNIQTKLRENFNEFLRSQDFKDEKLEQLNSFKTSHFPKFSNRPIRRSLKNQLRSYIANRLSQELQQESSIRDLLTHFYHIYSNRNEIGHSLENYLNNIHFENDYNTLLTVIKKIMDFELETFLNGEQDWKFERRNYELLKDCQKKEKERVLNKFSFTIDHGTQRDTKMRHFNIIRDLESVLFTGKFELIEENELGFYIRHIQHLKLFTLTHLFQNNDSLEDDSRVLNIKRNPECLFYTKVDDSHYIIKTFPPSNFIMEGSPSPGKGTSIIADKDVLRIIRLKSAELSDCADKFHFLENKTEGLF
ncbi:MAG: hypothetical protein BAJALOKI1v1_2070005 [Promethearchaeota archaeon]|nr:MAG: hypothetical protein BAJALOKI1v1_2070005 [Candidatus Lokiarchaeota archaeon]